MSRPIASTNMDNMDASSALVMLDVRRYSPKNMMARRFAQREKPFTASAAAYPAAWPPVQHSVSLFHAICRSFSETYKW